jgi:hypothetical protein
MSDDAKQNNEPIKSRFTKFSIVDLPLGATEKCGKKIRPMSFNISSARNFAFLI